MDGWKEEGDREERKGETLFENGNELAAKEMSMDRIISGKAKKSLFPLSLSLPLSLSRTEDPGYGKARRT